MKHHNILTKSALFLLTFVVGSYSFADIQTGYIATRVRFTGDSWQQITEPKLIPCAMKVGDQALTINHSVLIGFNAEDEQVTKISFPNPRAQIGDWDGALAPELVTDIFIPADAGMTYLIFEEQHDSPQDSLAIDVSNVDTEPVNCDAPVFELFPIPTEVAEEEVP